MLRDCLYCHCVTRSLFKEGKVDITEVRGVILNFDGRCEKGLCTFKKK